MADGFGMAALRLCGSVVSSLKTAPQIEKEINDQLAGKNWTFENYRSEQVTITVESITVRPKYSPKPISSGGVKKVEADNFFSELESERSGPTLSERLKAIVTGEWMTWVWLEIENGDADLIRPSGLNLHYSTTRKALQFHAESGDNDSKIFSVPAVRVSKPHDIRPDKLEMKFRYTGSLGEYRRRLISGVDILKYTQENMDWHVFDNLMSLHHSGRIENSNDFSWPDPDRARELGQYLVGGPVDLDSLADKLEEIQADIDDRNL